MSEPEIQPKDLIDTTENEAIEDKPEPEAAQTSTIEITDKKVKELTNEERSVLISNAKNGIDNQFFKVAFNKDGKPRITKRKAPKENTATKIINKRAPSMSTEQLLMEHVINLESQLASMRQKQKNLKRRYKDMYQDVYVTEEDYSNSTIATTAPTTTSNEPTEEQNQPNNLQQQPEQSRSQSNIFPNVKRAGWRARINPLF